jgi:hypothetical protein
MMKSARFVMLVYRIKEGVCYSEYANQGIEPVFLEEENFNR